MKFTLGKHQKLKSRKTISKLFLEGKSLKSFPLKMIYLPADEKVLVTKVAFSVPKRNFKRAVDRNQIKRLLREAYRLYQHEFFNQPEAVYYVMFIYTGSKKPSYQQLEMTIKKLFTKFNSLGSLSVS